MRMVRPEAVIDINRIAQLSQIEVVSDEIRIGVARQADVLASPDCQAAVPLLIEGLKNVGHYQTRSRGRSAVPLRMRTQVRKPLFA